MKKPLSERQRINAEIGTKISRSRRKCRMTQEQLARASGYINGGTVCHYESGRTEVSAVSLVLIARTLQVPASALLPDPTGVQFGDLEARLFRAYSLISDQDAAKLLVAMAERLAQPKEPTHQRGWSEAACNPESRKAKEPPALLALMEGNK